MATLIGKIAWRSAVAVVRPFAAMWWHEAVHAGRMGIADQKKRQPTLKFRKPV
jgi:hypothetical protein